MAVLHEKICSKENITPAPDQYYKHGTQDNSRYLHMHHEERNVLPGLVLG